MLHKTIHCKVTFETGYRQSKFHLVSCKIFSVDVVALFCLIFCTLKHCAGTIQMSEVVSKVLRKLSLTFSSNYTWLLVCRLWSELRVICMTLLFDVVEFAMCNLQEISSPGLNLVVTSSSCLIDHRKINVLSSSYHIRHHRLKTSNYLIVV